MTGKDQTFQISLFIITVISHPSLTYTSKED